MGVGERTVAVRPEVLVNGDDGGFGEAEVHELGAGLGEHDVAGLEVAMDDADAVGDFQSIADVDGVAEELVHGEGAAAEAGGAGFRLRGTP